MEHVFVDGGSSDNTRALIEQCFVAGPAVSATIPRLILSQRGSRGISAAWNLGLEHCRGEIVFILNSDDWYESHCAGRVLDTMRDNPQADIVHATARMYARGERYPSREWRNRPEWLLPILMPYVHPACFVRRSLYARLGMFDERYSLAMDYDFLWRCRASGVKSIKLPDVLTNFELGGSAHDRRREARIELYRIARPYHRVLPALALAARCLTNR